MKRPIKEAWKKYYEQFSLSDSQANHLGKCLKESEIRAKTYRGSKAGAAVIATIVVGVILIGFNVYKNTFHWPTKGFIEEIAYNHNKNLNPEIVSSSLKEIRKYLTKLDFALVLSEALPANEWELLGGRYCSIQKKLAAQLRLRNRKNNIIYTWYQVSDVHASINIKEPYESYKDGVKVRIWVEKGIMHCLAGVE